MAADPDRQARAQARRERIALHQTHLQAREPDPWPGSGAEAVSLVAELTRRSWSLAGLEWPLYPRAEIPIRFVPGAANREQDRADVAALEKRG